MLLTTPVPHDEAARLIRGKLPATRKLFDAMEPELQAAAVVITGVEDLHAIERVRNLVAEIPEGGDWDLAKDQIITELMPWLQDDEAAENRAELILRSHGYAAYAKANYAALEDQIEIFPWRKYQTAQDERVRGTHAALDGVIAPADSPFWRAHTPPWDFGCRCDIVGLTNDDVKELRGSNMRTAEGKPALKIIDRGPELEALEQGNLYRDGVMNFVARNPDGFKFDPEGGLVTLEMLQGLKKRVGAKLWDGFADWARSAAVPGSGTAWDYLTKPVRRRKAAAVVPTIPVPVTVPAPVVPPAPVKKGRLTATEKKREEIRTALYKSEQKLGGGVNSSAILRNGVHVVFKSGVGEDKRLLRPGIVPGTQYKREIAASIVDEYLGTGLVPPVAEVTWNGEVGSAMLYQAGFSLGGANPQSAVGMWKLKRPILERWQLLDDVTGHLDRHRENWMTDGKTVALIDNGLCLSEEPLFMGDWTRFPGPLNQKPMSQASRARLQKFQSRRSEIDAKLAPLVPQRAINNMWDRVDTMLRTNKHGL